MKRRTPNGWWNERSLRGQHGVYDRAIIAAPPHAARAPKPAYTPKGPAPLSLDHLSALRLIRDRLVRAAGLAAYYWSDRFMARIAWIDRGLLRFLKARKMIRKLAGGVYALTAIAVKLLAPAKRVLASGNSLSDSEALQRAAANIGKRAVTA